MNEVIAQKFATAGVWDLEPDQKSFIHAGLRCELRRGPVGAWCGYVGVDEAHPWFGKHYDAVVDGVPPENATIAELGVMSALFSGQDIDDVNRRAPICLLVPCHEGLTYANKGSHIEPDSKLWWFGFDCSHSGDLSPKSIISFDDDVYRDIEYATAATRKAAEAISFAASNLVREAA
ncbi:hypothetical protein [Rhizobium phaseoli]|uniref:hypothetical protein n=1 Tax=Rhizobium phaseoli TaxID=396 RepID=UPI0007EB040B|nr:hypothetical protein [Rhizobium phaseoli]